MAVCIVLLSVCALVMLFLVPKSRYGLPIFFIIMGMIFSIASILLQYYTSPTYSSPLLIALRNIDGLIYRKISKSIKVAMPYLQILKNIGIALYVFGTVSFLNVIKRNQRLEGTTKKPALRFIAYGIFALWLTGYLCFYSPNTAYHLYLKRLSLPSTRQAWFVKMVTGIHSFYSVTVLLCIFLPMFYVLFLYIKKRLTCFINTILTICLCLVYINMHFYVTFFVGIFRNNEKDVFNTGFWFFNRITKIPNVYIFLFPAFALCVLLFILLNINRFFSTDLLSLSKNRALKKSMNDLNQNLKDVFHSEKNLMFSILILANEAKNEYGKEEGLEKLNRIIDISTNQMNTISESLNRIKELHIHATASDLRSVTDSVLKNINMPEDVSIVKNYCSFPAMCMVDTYHTSQAIVNLIMNSLDALSMSTQDHKEIVITIDASLEWVLLSIKDNGVGMERKSIKKMMMPFESTKSKTGNWGIGLPYVFRVINAQLGQLSIEGSTKENSHFTKVDILFPRNRRSGHE